MKKRHLLYTLPMVAILLAACGDNNDDAATQKTPETTESTTDSNATKSDESTTATDPAEDKSSDVLDKATTKDGLPFTEFALDVDYPTGEYSLDYEKEFSGEDAELEDERKNTKIVGKDALNNLKPLLKKFTFDANTPDEQVKKQLFSIIKIDDDYTSIELEVTFPDNVEKKYVFNK